jgi:glycosyltransferase involved in cell wall biosynthesis
MPPQQPLVSILINNYNYARYLNATIASALNQTYPHVEVVVVDDGSTDDSKAVILSYGDRVVPVFKANGGQASALNAGFAASRGQIVCLLDADDLCLPHKVAEVVALFQAQPQAAWVFHESLPLQTAEIDRLKDLALEHQSPCPVEFIDFRPNILKAQIPDFTPSTSNLCFSRRLAAQIFPLPEGRSFSGAAINDFYIKYIAVGLEKGCVTRENLGIFRIHTQNAFSTQGFSRKRQVYAEMYLLTAYWMRLRFPQFANFSHKIFAKGLATYFKSKGEDLDYSTMIREYWTIASVAEKVTVGWKSVYYFIKLGFTSLV